MEREPEKADDALLGSTGPKSSGEGAPVAATGIYAAYEHQFTQFQRDIAGHTVTVLRDDGLYRHLRCSRDDGSYCMSFDVVTWPGYLCYSGDMGCFVFTRLSDMFEFFRGRHTAMIDRGYLAEKAVAADKHDGIREYSEDLFEAAVQGDFDGFTDGWTEEAKAALWENINDEVLVYKGDGLQRAVEAAQDFQFYDADAGKWTTAFHDFWEHRLEDYTPRFWWCCYAIPWAIERYDAARKPSDNGAVQAQDATGGKA